VAPRVVIALEVSLADNGALWLQVDPRAWFADVDRFEFLNP